MKRYIYTTLIFLGLASVTVAKENVNGHRYSGPQQGNQVFSNCAPSKSRADLDVNNVRCPIWINGDMWWDLLGDALYEIPVGSGKHSLFAGAIWIGGTDAAGQLKVAAQTYRQSGSDFWPGPVDVTTVTIPADQCLKYDKHFKVSFADVKNFHEEYQVNGNLSYPIPEVIKNWPGNGDVVTYHQDLQLAPFYDRAGDGVYDYNDGDYPKYNVDGSLDPCDKSSLLGDQTIWWVFNDVGNIHKETDSQYAVGVEIQAQAFGFNTNDEINNMTFYRYKIINRASQVLNNTYFGAWVDPDLGNYLDDYVGCDVERGLGFCYNGDADDDGALGYGLNPPAVGMDFFEGPVADTGDGLDNNRNGVIDEIGEQIIMSKFVYYNNDGTKYGNPTNAQEYYNYLRGIWRDNSPMVYGGTGYQTPGADSCDFMFPGTSDPDNIGTHGVPQSFVWTEETPTGSSSVPNEPSDRRFLQSAGAFTLQPGAVNYITTGVVWARASSGGPKASVKLVKLADVKAQNLFESCFKVANGPQAPVVSIRELDKELILSVTNPAGSNNAGENYTEKDINIPASPIAIYRFEGYKIFQVKDESVSVNDLTNADKARLVFQCDLKNGVSQIVNSVLDGNINAFVPTEMVVGEDNGLRHTLRVTTDAFATGDPTLVNHKTYYFMAIAYGYDAFADLNPTDIPDTMPPGIYGQPYIQSRQNAFGNAIDIVTGIPHISSPEDQGLVLSTSYGDGPEITRLTGMGNGYVTGGDRGTLDLKQDQIDNILFSASNPVNQIYNPTYQRGRGPVDIRVYDPVKVAPAEFELYLTDTVASSGNWVLKNLTTGTSVTSEKTIENPYDQLFSDYGFYVSINQVKNTGEAVNEGNGFIEGVLEYANTSNRWFNGIPDLDNFNNTTQLDWIIAGKNATAPYLVGTESLDPNNFYGKILTGTWAPFRLVNNSSNGDRVCPAPFRDGAGSPYGSTSACIYDDLKYLNSVDIVFTTDKSKWSRCVVIEEGTNAGVTEGNQIHGMIRKHKGAIKESINYGSNGVTNVAYSDDTTDYGYSWFPGYAINLETGERLNIAFGEDSYLSSDNGNDMAWNPTSNFGNFDNSGNLSLLAGGKHYIYVFANKTKQQDDVVGAAVSATGVAVNPYDSTYWGPAYDGCKYIRDNLWGLNLGTAGGKRTSKKIWKDCMWVGVPLLAPGQTLLSSDLKVRLRVTKPYRQYATGTATTNNNYPYYKFSTRDLAPQVKQVEVAKSALDLINVVPNPYYAYSGYETGQLDNRVKIVNLPNKCTISIYSPSGTLVRQFKRDVGQNNTDGSVYPEENLESSQDWDLKNSKGVPIASGMYIIHISADGVGEKTIKWFGVIRPLDLDTF